MSVEFTRLPSGLVIVTDQMAHLETASLGVWVSAGSRDERADEHGISHLLEHMAFKGTSGAARARLPKRSKRSAGISMLQHRSRPRPIMRASCAPMSRWRSMSCPTFSPNPSFDPEELRREQNVIVQEIGAAEDTPDDLIWDRLQEVAFAGQPIGRSILGTPATVRSFDRARLAAYLAPQLSRAGHGGCGGGRGRPPGRG